MALQVRMSMRRRIRREAICAACGQFHEPGGTHLYDYHQAVDEDLMCQICLQPLVAPCDTKCGHTFCSRCLRNYLKVQPVCTIDRTVINLKECQQSSILVRKLLDKLLVVCPNVDYCEEVLPRAELEAHLLQRCRGAVTRCIKAGLGCTFRGPRSALQSHLWECQYRDCEADKNPVVDGEVSTIEIKRTCPDLGMSIVGGIDTPLPCIVIQEVFPDGVVAKDGRLLQGDQILEVNGEDLTQVSHTQAQQALVQFSACFRVTVYREKAEESKPIEKEEILKITLNKSKGKQLGIKLVGKRNGPGLFILNLVTSGQASIDGRLKPDDRVLEINGQDLSYGAQDQAAHIIKSSIDRVQFVISRRSRPQTPDLIRSSSTAQDISSESGSSESDIAKVILCKKCTERFITVTKAPLETLGISVAGGVRSPRGDTPIYITNINPTGCLGRTRQVKKGDILLSINGTSLFGLSHAEAVKILKCNAEAKSITLRIMEGPETCEGPENFTPSWLYWLQLPEVYQSLKVITLLRSPIGSLGFSVVGGCDSSQGSVPIYVKSVVLETPASQDGRLRCGDMLVTVNDNCLQKIAHSKAVNILKQVEGNVTLTVVSWPGTVI